MRLYKGWEQKACNPLLSKGTRLLEKVKQGHIGGLRPGLVLTVLTSPSCTLTSAHHQLSQDNH